MNTPLESFAQDVRYGARQLRQSPWFTIVAIASVSIGIGSGLALFTLMNAVLLRPLPGRNTSDIQQIHTSDHDGDKYGSSSYADFRSFTSVPGLFSGTCAWARVRGNLVVDARPLAADGAVVSGGCFETLRVRAQTGRLLNASDETALVISYALWQRAFAGDPAVVGRSALLNGASTVIVGVAEQGFAGWSLDRGAEFWVPPALAPQLIAPEVLTARTDRRFRVYARLNDGVTAKHATERLAGVAAQLRDEDPATWTQANGATRAVTIVPELESRFADDPGQFLELAALTLAAISAIVLIACINLATMTLARGVSRTHELSVRLALGASRGRVLRQLATESLMISVAGAGVGVIFVNVVLKVFDAYRPAEIPAFNLAIDWHVVAFAGLIAVAAPLLFGLAPGASALRLAIHEGLKGQPVLRRRGLLIVGPREILLAVQVAASFALLVMAVLFMQSLAHPELERAAIPTERIAVVSVDFNVTTGMESGMLDAMSRVAGVESVTAAAVLPDTGSTMGFSGEGDTVFAGNIVAPGYFDIAGITRLAGRDFDIRDHARAPKVVVVSEAFAQRMWNGTDVIGRTLRVSDSLREVVAVVNKPAESFVYLPWAQVERERMLLHARVRSGPEILAALDRAVNDVDARIIVGPVMPLRQWLDQFKAPVRATQWLGGAAGILQLGLALMAVWGLVTYAVERRSREVAIRLALGATRSNILHLIMRPSVWLLAIGAVVGCGVGIASTMVMHSEFVGLAPLDLTIVLPVAVLLLAVILTVAWLPSRRAAAIEPASALKQN
jgi:predicted permease